MTFDFNSWSNNERERFESSLHAVFTQKGSPALREASQYPLTTGGKRIRPLFVMAAAQAFPTFDHQSARCSALSIELIHTYSLVHDDLPCMDDDDLRRGMPTVHKRFGEAPALLVGDVLLTEAFAVLCPSPHLPQVLPIITQAAGIAGMIEGQSYDIGFEGSIDTIEQLKHLHLRKTGALIQASAQLGGIAAGATSQEQEALIAYGQAIGLAFQLADDVLDEEQDMKEEGPPSFVKLLGRQRTQELAIQYRDEALLACSNFPRPQALQALAEFSIARSY